MNRSTMPYPGGYSNNPEMARAISESPVFASVANQLEHERELQAQRFYYGYTLSGSVVGQVTSPAALTIEQGTDFDCFFMTGSVFSYDAGNASAFPMPNSAGLTAWAGRGLSIKITDTRSGRELTSGYVAAENVLTPGYGQNFQQPYRLRYLFYRNSKIRFDLRNRDNATRTHYYEIVLHGFKVTTPQ